MNKYLLKKCQQCIKFNKNGTCSFYDFSLAETYCLTCQFDKRKICKLCFNYDKNTSFCKILTKNKFKDENTLRICNSFVLNERNKNE